MAFSRLRLVNAENLTWMTRLSSVLVVACIAGCEAKITTPTLLPNSGSQSANEVVTTQPSSWALTNRPIETPSQPSPRAPRPDDWFMESAPNISFTYRNGREGNKFTLLESIGGGVALFDYDNDSAVDLFFVGGGTIDGSPIVIGGLPNAFYRNLGDFQFSEIGTPAGISTSFNYTVGCSVCDFNCDGHPDVFITGYPHCRFFCNQGDGTFKDLTESELVKDAGLHAASVWGDFDSDGLPDLYVTGYVTFDLREDRNCGEDLRGIRDICGIWQYPPAPDRIYRNAGDGNFIETTTASGLRNDGKGLGAVAADMNADGALDLYVGNDFTPNFLYLGNGQGNFTERGLPSGTALDTNGSPQGTMGVDFGDYDGDGRGDLLIANYQLEDNLLYRNLGDGLFSAATHIGLEDVCRPYVGFGTGWVDFDSDGWRDLFVLNGHVMYHTGQSPYEQPQFLFRNREGQRFENRSDQGGPYFSVRHVARGGAVGDLNNDGAPDLVVVHQNAPVTILKNRMLPMRWVSICLHGTSSDPFAVGAVVTSKFSQRELVRHVRGGGGYMSHFDRRIGFPVDENSSGECTVQWLNGKREVFRNLLPGREHAIIEGRGAPL